MARRFDPRKEYTEFARAVEGGRTRRGEPRADSGIMRPSSPPPGDQSPRSSGRPASGGGGGRDVDEIARGIEATHLGRNLEALFGVIPTALRMAAAQQGDVTEGFEGEAGGRNRLSPGEVLSEFMEAPEDQRYSDWLRDKGAPEWLQRYGGLALEVVEPGPGEFVSLGSAIARVPWGKVVERANRKGRVTDHVLEVVGEALEKPTTSGAFLGSLRRLPDERLQPLVRKHGLGNPGRIAQETMTPENRGKVFGNIGENGNFRLAQDGVFMQGHMRPDGEVYIEALENVSPTAQAGRGLARGLPEGLQAILDLADAHEVPMRGLPSAFEGMSGSAAMDTEDLRWMYNSFGFEPDAAGAEMVRRPLPMDDAARRQEATRRFDDFRQGQERPARQRSKTARQARTALNKSPDEQERIFREWAENNLRRSQESSGTLSRMVPGVNFQPGELPPARRVYALIDSTDSPFYHALERSDDSALPVFRGRVRDILDSTRRARAGEIPVRDVERQVEDFMQLFEPIAQESHVGALGMEETRRALDEVLDELVQMGN